MIEIIESNRSNATKFISMLDDRLVQEFDYQIRDAICRQMAVLWDDLQYYDELEKKWEDKVA
jgi:hypothetical protein